MRAIFIALLALVLLVSCAHVNPLPGSPKCAKNHVQQVFYTNDPWTADEIEQLESAPRGWSALSKDRIHFAILYATPPAGANVIRRVVSTDQVVKDQDAHQTAVRGAPFVSAGWSPAGDATYLVVDRIGPGQLGPVLTHELGHRAGLRWPGCSGPDPDQKCIHSPDPTAIMFGGGVNAKSLGPGDLAFCEASCLCD